MLASRQAFSTTSIVVKANGAVHQGLTGTLHKAKAPNHKGWGFRMYFKTSKKTKSYFIPAWFIMNRHMNS